jgi:hypothetical protein
VIAALAPLLLTLAGAASGQAPAAANDAAPARLSSIVRAQVMQSHILGTANCSPDPNALCIDVLIEARLAILGHVAGPRIPSEAVVRYIYHMPAPRGAIGWWLITASHPPRPYRPALPLTPTAATNRRRLCVDTSMANWFGAAPPGGSAQDDTLCYPR